MNIADTIRRKPLEPEPMRRPPREQPKPRPIRLVDAIRHSQLDKQPDQAMPGPKLDILAIAARYPRPDAPVPLPNGAIQRGRYRHGRGRQRGPEAILALFASWGVYVEVVAGQLSATGPNGAMPPTAAELLRVAAPLLLGYLTDQAMKCVYRYHGSGSRDAVSLTEPSLLPACGQCLDHDFDTDPAA